MNENNRFIKFMAGVKYLLIDADDTLWENNIYYEIATADFFKLCHSAGISAEISEQEFLATEKKYVTQFGYGSANFLQILNIVFHDTFKLHLNNEARLAFEVIVAQFRKHVEMPPPVFQNVEKTLSALSKKYNLYLLTKGDFNEQKRKFEQSDLLPFFKEAFIRSEKNSETYIEILASKNWQPSEVCMIGNSPKSDINPALRCGIRAVFIPYPFTWRMDIEDMLSEHPLLLEIQNFGQLS